MATLEQNEESVQGTSTSHAETIEWFIHLESTYKVAVVSAKYQLQKARTVPTLILMHFAFSARANTQRLKIGNMKYY